MVTPRASRSCRRVRQRRQRRKYLRGARRQDPHAAAGASVLPGITRDAILTLARDLGIPVVETIIPRELLYIADEVFFSGTAAEITPIRSIDKITIGKGSRASGGAVAEGVLRRDQRVDARSARMVDA